MNFFEQAATRLKQQLGQTEDRQIAEALGLSPGAWVKRKARDAFPRTELYALAAKRPDLRLDVEYVLTGVATGAQRAAEPTASYLAGKIPAKLRALRELHGLPAVCGVGEVKPDQWLAFEGGEGRGYPPGFLHRLALGFSLDPQSFFLDAQDVTERLSPMEKDLLAAYRAAREEDQDLIRRVAYRFAGVSLRKN
jgi:hypothetical protein